MSSKLQTHPMALLLGHLSPRSKRFHTSAALLRPRTDDKRIGEALQAIRRTFPFDEYLFDMEPHAFLARLISKRLLPRGGRILDLGGGACDKAAVLAQLGFQCEVWDDLRDPWHREGKNVQWIKSFARRHGVALRVREIGHNAFDREAFDLVMINDVLEHLHESPRYMLNVAVHSLRKEGVLLIMTPNAANVRKRLSVLFGGTNHPPAREFFDSAGLWRGHVREWTIAETARLLLWMGLMEVRTKTFHGLLGQRVSSPLARSLYRALTTPFPFLWDTICAWGRKPPEWAQVEAPKQPGLLFPVRFLEDEG